MNIVLLGSGNVATHLGQALKRSGHTMIQVWSRSTENAQVLAGLLQAEAVSDISKLSDSADIYIISVKDDVIAEVAAGIPFKNKLLVHTAGSVEIDVLKDFSADYGVIYPLQTFSKNHEVDLGNVPFILEASSSASGSILKQLAVTISSEVYFLTSEQRQILHLAAVFACNFTNHLYALSDNLLGRHQLKFDLLKPLVMETARKVQAGSPKNVQTGPAVRNDRKVMNKHRELLKGDPDLNHLYQLLSQSIVNLN